MPGAECGKWYGNVYLCVIVLLPIAVVGICDQCPTVAWVQFLPK